MHTQKWVQKIVRQKSGLTLPELMISALLLLPIFVGTLYVFVQCIALNELSLNTSTASWESKSRITQIENTAFDQIFATYDGATFTSANLTGIGVSYVDNSNPQMLAITTNFSWQQKSGRIIGEDLDLDGQIDNGEDIDGDGMLTSPVQLVTYVYDRS